MTTTLDRVTVNDRKRRNGVPRAHRFTRQEVYDLSDRGRFDGLSVSLIRGRIIVMPAPSPLHVYAVKRLESVLQPLLPPGHFARLEHPLGIDDYTDPAPEYAIVKGTFEEYLHEHPRTAVFVAEVALSTLRTDARVKPHVYAKAGVPEYWVVDLVHRRVIVHRDPLRDDDAPFKHRYGTMLTLQESDTIAPLMAPASPLAVAALMPPVA